VNLLNLRHWLRLRTNRELAVEYQQLLARRLATLVPVREPLVLVSQVQRSGGTLLSQLFDHHPELHAHPSELRWGAPDKYHWPTLDLGASPEEWYRTLKEPTGAYLQGYNKDSFARVREVAPTELDRYPFLQPRRLAHDLFVELVTRTPPARERDLLDAHLTAYFNAWLDYQGLYAQPKRWVTAFTARLALEPGNAERLFAAYPDGLLISLVREPKAWFASASRHDPHAYGDPEAAVHLWLRLARSLAEAKTRDPGRVVILPYERLVTDTEAVMRSLAKRLGITWSPILLEPTFNGMPIKADSSFEVAGFGVRREPVERGSTLASGVAAKIERAAAETYGQLLELAA
jgi:hypothetical protein